jgi:hypothetical protein
MNKEEFLKALQKEAATFTKAVATSDGDWIIKGFIDVYKRVYTISVDIKVISKVLELLLFPEFVKFAERHELIIELSPQQNFYPDLTFISRVTRKMFAVDIKSTYRINDTKVSGMTLGAFTGYFRNRDSTKNTLYPYNQYEGHFVLGVVYSREELIDERKIYALEDLEKIRSVIRNFEFFAQPKYRIASTSPGSGNTKNIGSVTKLNDLINGEGPFSKLGEEVYDDYWMYYLTKDMANTIGQPRPYSDLKSYLAYKSRGMDKLKANEVLIESLEEESE